MSNPEEDTEWNDILRTHKIIPEKGPSDRDIFYAVADAEVERRRQTNPLEDEDLEGLEELEDDFDDEVIQEYRRKRMQEMQDQASNRRFGDVRYINKPDWVREVTEASQDVHVVVHMYKEGWVPCRLLNSQLEELAKHYAQIKFVKIISDQCVPGYPDRNLPTLLVYSKGDVQGQLIGPQAFTRGTHGKYIIALMKQSGAIKDTDPGLARAASDGKGESSEADDSDYDL
ncbi:MAG: thioredoxin-like protein [Piptocephalis tieghemiana]|nr:MAG: thioredoxin-like protein [Piptocephalis tieghemiana]